MNNMDMHMHALTNSITPDCPGSHKLLPVVRRSVSRVIFLLLVLSWCCLPVYADEPRALYLENESWSDSRFQAKGSVLTSQTAYTFNIASITIKVSDELTSPLHIIGVKLGYAYQLSKEEWEVHGLSPLHELQLAILPGEEKQLAGFETSMPIGKDLGGFQHWVIMQFIVRDKQHGEIYFYAHEPQE